MPTYYNDNDPYAAEWLKRLIRENLIAPGEVDGRSIKDVAPDDLKSFTQCHFFAGIGGWSHALRLAGWPDERPVWTASCPCQPYSHASVGHGGAKGQGDGRDLWPDFFRLAAQRKPPTIFGEQVGAAIGWTWWDRAALDLESAAYAVAASVLRADTFGHQRKRLYWVADAGGTGWQGRKSFNSIPVPEAAPLPEYGNAASRARRALDGDFSDLLHCNGLSVVMERHALKGYGNAIVPPVAAEFIMAFTETQE